MARQPAKEFVREVLLTLTEEPRMHYGVVRWVVDGRAGQPVIEKREMYETEEGTPKSGKLRGINKADWDLLKENQAKVEEIFAKG